MVTHDLDSIYSVCDRIAALADKKVIAAGTLSEVLAVDHPWVQAYFHGERARRRDTGADAPAPLKAP
jgi:phospholipid/cholesterol/gamma-HCH transport system ATP-binding protein